MRRNHYIALVTLTIILWVGVINYVFLRRMKSKDPLINENLDKFENDLDIAINDSDSLIGNLRTFLKEEVDPIEKSLLELAETKSKNSENAVVFGNIRNLGKLFQSSSSSSSSSSSVSSLRIGEEKTAEVDVRISHEDTAIAILVIACDRVTISKCLDHLIMYRPSEKEFPIIVSQDCIHKPTTEVIKSYGDKIYHIHQPNQQDVIVPPKEKKFKGYFKISRHYGWALNQTFLKYNFNTVIIVEDDLDIAPDFYEYFKATLPILQRDPTLWCVSAWNDNGLLSLVDKQAKGLLYRTDFFPGLGWMLLKSLWLELMNKWPKSYWDDWMRRPEQRNDRSCIRPELSRTKTFGKIGVSNGLFYEKHLKYIYLNEDLTKFTNVNLTYLIKSIYDYHYERVVYTSPVVNFEDLKNSVSLAPGSVRIVYWSRDSFKRICKQMGLMDDLKSGVPRTSYRGIISFVFRNRRVFLVPQWEYKEYNLSWH